MKKLRSSKKASRKAAKKPERKKSARRGKISPIRGKGATKRKKHTQKKVRKKMQGVKTITINEAKYLRDYVLLITFNNGHKQEVDFLPFFKTNDVPYLKKYKSQKNFQNFKVEEGNVVWGRDWDLIFPIYKLYQGQTH